MENEDTGECRQVIQLQFISWPDFGVPSSPIDFLRFYYEVASEEQAATLRCPGVPILVHCSAGVGRTGAFCTIMNALQLFKTQGEMDIARIVHVLRGQRYGMVQTLEQYVFCYRCIALALLGFYKLIGVKSASLLSISSFSDSISGEGTSSSPSENVSSPDDKLKSSEDRPSLHKNKTNEFTNQPNKSDDSTPGRNAPPYSYSRTLVFPPFDTVLEEESVSEAKAIQDTSNANINSEHEKSSLTNQNTNSKERKKNAAERKKRLSQLGEPPPPPQPPPKESLLCTQPSPPTTPPPLFSLTNTTQPSPATSSFVTTPVVSQLDYDVQPRQINSLGSQNGKGFENHAAYEFSEPDLIALTSLDHVLAVEEECIAPPDEFAVSVSAQTPVSNIESQA